MTDRKVSPGTSPIACAPEEGQYGLIGGGLVIWVGVMLLLLNSGLLGGVYFAGILLMGIGGILCLGMVLANQKPGGENESFGFMVGGGIVMIIGVGIAHNFYDGWAFLVIGFWMLVISRALPVRSRQWLSIALPVVLIAASVGVYFVVLRPNLPGDPGGVEGFITDELGRGIPGLRVSIIDGSVGFPEITASTSETGYYQIGSVSRGTFTIGIHDEQGDLLGEKTFKVERGKTSSVDIALRGFVVYDSYGGVDIFDEGIYVIATDEDPRTLMESGEYSGNNDFWSMIKEGVTQNPSTTDFISVIISRGDQPSGGYQIQLKSLVWLQSYPVVGFFKANFTDPGESGPVVEPLTNPLVLVPIGKLSAGLYVGRVHIDSFIMQYDSGGDPVYSPIMTLVEEVWETEFEVS
jgi:hypothetical protein